MELIRCLLAFLLTVQSPTVASEATTRPAGDAVGRSEVVVGSLSGAGQSLIADEEALVIQVDVPYLLKGWHAPPPEKRRQHVDLLLVDDGLQPIRLKRAVPRDKRDLSYDRTLSSLSYQLPDCEWIFDNDLQEFTAPLIAVLAAIPSSAKMPKGGCRLLIRLHPQRHAALLRLIRAGKSLAYYCPVECVLPGTMYCPGAFVTTPCPEHDAKSSGATGSHHPPKPKR